MTRKVGSVGCLGAGVMGEAIITGIIKNGLVAPENIFASDINEDRLSYIKKKLGINVFRNNKEPVKKADVVIMAVKPNIVEKILPEINGGLTGEHTLISIAAGITTSFIEQQLDDPVPVIRVMPNTPCLLGEGASALCRGRYAGQEHEDTALAVFESIGRAVVVPEKLMDAATGLSGSGPAYVYLFIEALIDGGVRMGLPRDVAATLAAQTVLGAARMVRETGEHPALLKAKVSTPGGTTVAGLYALEKGALRSTVMDAVKAAAKRSEELRSLQDA